MKRSSCARFTSLCLVSALTVSSCNGITDIAGDVDGGSVGGQANVGGSPGTDVGGTSSVGGDTIGPVPSGTLPCDIFQSVGNACVAAHSTVRVLVGGYGGPLYQIQRTSDSTTKDIGSVGGYADAASQNAFCAGDLCSIMTIYDQSGHDNNLTPAPPGGNNPSADLPARADQLPVQASGHNVYGVRIKPGMGYRKLVGNGTARGDEPQTIYMVTSQRYLINGCCFDYGNAETTAHDEGNGCVEAVYFGSGVIWGTGSGPGPWVMADLENALFAGWENHQERAISTNTSLQFSFVTAILVGDTAEKNAGKGRFALYGGDATSGNLTTMYDGIRPEHPGYVPMTKQGSIILGIAGDNTAAGAGPFYEGVMASGAATKPTLDALQASIVAAGYGQPLTCKMSGAACFVDSECCTQSCLVTADGGFCVTP